MVTVDSFFFVPPTRPGGPLPAPAPPRRRRGDPARGEAARGGNDYERPGRPLEARRRGVRDGALRAGPRGRHRSGHGGLPWAPLARASARGPHLAPRRWVPGRGVVGPGAAGFRTHLK